METKTAKQQPESPLVPGYLIKEVLDGKPVYYNGYKAVLSGGKTIDEIMGSSSLQRLILWYLSRIVLSSKNLDDSQYFVFTGEPGLHVEKRNNLSGDLMIYDRSQVSLFNVHYFQTPPLVNVEIDVNIDNSTFSDYEYIQRKTSNLLTFGVQRVIWILTTSQQVILAEPAKDWLVIDWHKDIELFNGITFNIPAYFEQEGLSLSPEREA
ncbi:hypothetical protein GCM10023187_44310 [Nibrella viscosa]|uniref:Uma2 family endonuclease n=1 Tax=Nibrella viscosa TaxID=1084524 RepID=A0ABP8KTQ4_9BACT